MSAPHMRRCGSKCRRRRVNASQPNRGVPIVAASSVTRVKAAMLNSSLATGVRRPRAVCGRARAWTVDSSGHFCGGVGVSLEWSGT